MKKTTLAKVLSLLLAVTTVFSFFTSTAIAAPVGDGGEAASELDAVTPTNSDGEGETQSTQIDPSANYQLEFDIGEGATGKPEAITGNGPVKLPVSVPKKEGFTFLGWTTNDEDKETEYYGAGSLFTLTEDTVLYATWRDSSIPEGKFALIFDPNGGSGEPERIINSGKITLPTEEPERTGYLFEGWATTNRAKEAQYKKGAEFNLVEDTTLYAFWTPDGTVTENYTITYDANGGQNAPYEQSGSGKIYLTEALPTREDYKFLGWADSKTATAAQKQPGDEFTLEKDITLYAVWKQVIFTLSYNANGGTAAPAAQKTNDSGKVTVSSSKPTRSGYNFLGWSTSKTATTADVKYKAGTSVTLTANTVLYAVWKKVDTPSDPTSGYKIEIKNYKSELSVSYKSKLTFHATTNVPSDKMSDYEIVWYINNKPQTEKGSVYIIYQATADVYTVQAKLVRVSDGTAVKESATERVKVSTNFFAKLVAIVRQLFKRLPEYEDNTKVK